jgi:hypothetical protein
VDSVTRMSVERNTSPDGDLFHFKEAAEKFGSEAAERILIEIN